MTRFPDLNKLKRRRTDMGDNTEDVELANYSTLVTFEAGAKAAVHFRDLESPLLRYINEADAVVGCVAWFTNLQVLGALASKQAASILVQKEDFLRPDLGPSKARWKADLQAHYEALRPIEVPLHIEAGWLEVRTAEELVGLGEPVNYVGIRCVGHYQAAEPEKNTEAGKKFRPAIPRMHHKFLVFLRKRSELDSEVLEGAWPYRPYAVWTGSYNITGNGKASLENALFVRDEKLAAAYCDEWAQLVELSEPLDWKSEYAAPEIDYNTGAFCS